MTAPEILLKMAQPPLQPITPVDPFMDMISQRLRPGDILCKDPLSDKQQRSVINRFATWLEFQPTHPLLPDLANYRDYLTDVRGYAPCTVVNNLYMIRKRYEMLIRDRVFLFSIVTVDGSWLERKAVVDELVTRIQHRIHTGVTRVRLKSVQDHPDAIHRRLSHDQSMQLLSLPDSNRLLGLRDAAMIALALCTGIRVSELMGLDVVDLRQRFSGELALHVRNGKGSKERMVPYGDMAWCLRFVDTWQKRAGIESGPVFCQLKRARGRDDQELRPGQHRLSTKAFRSCLNRYLIQTDDQTEPIRVQPHDLRRTYALNCYLAGMDMLRIQRNMGHVRSATTLRYIGALDGQQRRPPAVYQPSANLFDQLDRIEEEVNTDGNA